MQPCDDCNGNYRLCPPCYRPWHRRLCARPKELLSGATPWRSVEAAPLVFDQLAIHTAKKICGIHFGYLAAIVLETSGAPSSAWIIAIRWKQVVQDPLLKRPRRRVHIIGHFPKPPPQRRAWARTLRLRRVQAIASTLRKSSPTALGRPAARDDRTNSRHAPDVISDRAGTRPRR